MTRRGTRGRMSLNHNIYTVVEELLKTAVLLDYRNEIGRKMHPLFHEWPSLPRVGIWTHVSRTVHGAHAGSERDLVRLVAIEIVQALRPGNDEDAVLAAIDHDSSFDSTANTPGARSNAAAARRGGPKDKELTETKRYMRIRLIRGVCVESMLERINGTLENNSSLDEIVKGLIYPGAQPKDGNLCN
ncbi:hypothetical protein GYMLUDRAFT_732112 [Collybiopsis luxurians FD-317 M1]|nr:hypothetical protein GYMLUDRAFT_732112 [Collybiopsis luxurians FD-317 M1]